MHKMQHLTIEVLHFYLYYFNIVFEKLNGVILR